MPQHARTEIATYDVAPPSAPAAAASSRDATRRFWSSHLIRPGLVWLAVFALLQVTQWDVAFSDLHWDAASGLWPARASFWADTLLHSGGKHFVYAINAAVLAVFLLGFTRLGRQEFAPWRRAAGYLLLCLALVPLTVTTLRRQSDVPCPVSIDRYGGARPYLPLFAARPELPGSGCFPGAHSSVGFSLLAFYFIWRRARPARARRVLAAAFAVGAAFAYAQTARGAHFLSHDLVSLALAWLICAAVYALAYGRRLHPDDA